MKFLLKAEFGFFSRLPRFVKLMKIQPNQISSTGWNLSTILTNFRHLFSTIFRVVFDDFSLKRLTSFYGFGSLPLGRFFDEVPQLFVQLPHLLLDLEKSHSSEHQTLFWKTLSRCRTWSNLRFQSWNRSPGSSEISLSYSSKRKFLEAAREGVVLGGGTAFAALGFGGGVVPWTVIWGGSKVSDSDGQDLYRDSNTWAKKKSYKTIGELWFNVVLVPLQVSSPCGQRRGPEGCTCNSLRKSGERQMRMFLGWNILSGPSCSSLSRGPWADWWLNDSRAAPKLKRRPACRKAMRKRSASCGTFLAANRCKTLKVQTTSLSTWLVMTKTVILSRTSLW